MAKYTFIYEHDSSPFDGTVSSKRTVEFRADALDQILPEFESFLRGCGFTFDGYIDVVEDYFDDRSDHYDEQEEDSPNFDFSSIPKNNSLFSTPHDDIKLDFGAAQPAMNFDIDNFDTEGSISIDLNESSEKCPICKIPKSVMKAEKCYDSACPKTSWLTDLDYKLASEK